MPKDTKTLGNNKARACESLGFAHKKRLCQRFDTTSSSFKIMEGKMRIYSCFPFLFFLSSSFSSPSRLQSSGSFLMRSISMLMIACASALILS